MLKSKPNNVLVLYSCMIGGSGVNDDFSLVVFVGVYERELGAAFRETKRNRSTQSGFNYTSSSIGL